MIIFFFFWFLSTRRCNAFRRQLECRCQSWMSPAFTEATDTRKKTQVRFIILERIFRNREKERGIQVEQLKNLHTRLVLPLTAFFF